MRLRTAFCMVLVPMGIAYGQKIIGGSGSTVALGPQDRAILENHERRRDLRCSVTAIHPELGFDLSLHTGYEVRVSMEDLTGSRNMLTALFRITPVEQPGNQTYFYQRWAVPELAEGASGSAELQGRFRLGEGHYRVEWLMRDQQERYCSAHWQIDAFPHNKDRPVELRLHSASVAETPDPFFPEVPLKADAGSGLKVLVMLHVASPDPGAPGMRTEAIPPVMSILRSIAREPRIGSYSVTAFNLGRSQILFRRDHTPDVDFPALGKAIENVQLNTIDARRAQYDSESRFLGELLADEMRTNHPDAVIFVGPKTSPEAAMRGTLKTLAVPRCPVFYLTYIADPSSNPWKDLIGSAVKLWKGIEYTITRPRDLYTAWNEVISRIPNQDSVGDIPELLPLGSGLRAKK